MTSFVVTEDGKKRNRQAEPVIANFAEDLSEFRNSLVLSRSNSSLAKSTDRGLHL